MNSNHLWLVLHAACAEAEYEPERACAEAIDILAECGYTFEQSPFGTCQADEAELAERIIVAYKEGGCANLSSAKTDSAICATLPLLCVEHSVAELVPFVTDGCSMFPDGALTDRTRWQQCCITHDFAYYAGGPEELREAADVALQQCMRAVSNVALADLVYYGVRLGGTPALPTPWRWGYGWRYDPLDGYRTLPAGQADAAAANLDAYRANPVPPDAFEQRLLALVDKISLVPGLDALVDQVNAIVRNL